ncbi:MAG: TadE/TadG family type IV pilus assembly protein [Coriobacteriia bacterium]|nr:TadE/TadG family type IV pilus assembly protein [Coriobacteriia bacterium]
MLLVKEDGQATVEAAIMIPIIFLLMLLLIQPGILLYDWIVMNEACAETCRAVSTISENEKQSMCESYARRRLAAIPQQDNFHVHSIGCSYDIQMSGNNTSPSVTVEIKNEVKPLPLIGFLSQTLGILNENQNFEIKASSTQQCRPSWIREHNAEKWVGSWLQ